MAEFATPMSTTTTSLNLTTQDDVTTMVPRDSMLITDSTGLGDEESIPFTSEVLNKAIEFYGKYSGGLRLVPDMEKIFELQPEYMSLVYTIEPGDFTSLHEMAQQYQSQHLLRLCEARVEADSLGARVKCYDRQTGEEQDVEFDKYTVSKCSHLADTVKDWLEEHEDDEEESTPYIEGLEIPAEDARACVEFFKMYRECPHLPIKLLPCQPDENFEDCEYTGSSWLSTKSEGKLPTKTFNIINNLDTHDLRDLANDFSVKMDCPVLQNACHLRMKFILGKVPSDQWHNYFWGGKDRVLTEQLRTYGGILHKIAGGTGEDLYRQGNNTGEEEMKTER